jgi:hypothetical protein
VKVSFNVKGYTDRRTPELVARYQLIETARDPESGRKVQVVSRLAEVGANRQGAGAGITGPARIWPATAGAPFRVVRVR